MATNIFTCGDVDPLLIDLPDAAKLLGLSPKNVWILAKSNRLPSIKIGARRKFSVEALRSWIVEQHALQGGCT